MRSRYSAYALGLIDYIIATSDPDTPQDRAGIEEFCKSTQFKNLKILETGENTVTFKATLFSGDHDISFTEKSFFKKIDGRWHYISGTVK